MSECMAAEIEIGGDIPAYLVPVLIENIKSEGLFVGWQEENFHAETAEDLLELARRKGKPGTLHLADIEASWGHFDVLEDFLATNGIAFDRRSEGKYEFDPELVQYRPRMKQPLLRYTHHDHEPVVALRDLKKVQQALEDGKLERARMALRRLLGPQVAPLQPLRVVGSSARDDKAVNTWGKANGIWHRIAKVVVKAYQPTRACLTRCGESVEAGSRTLIDLPSSKKPGRKLCPACERSDI